MVNRAGIYMSMVDKEEARREIEKRVQVFKESISKYKEPSYKEHQLRAEFLDKLFKCLGWDIGNDAGLPPSYREVVTEETLEIEGRAKSPDYSFRIRGGDRMFFVEAKKPHVGISENAKSAFQLRRYGWNADVSVSILSNFEWLAVYDCTVKPERTQDAGYARLELIHFEQYVERFDYLWDTFSKSAVHCGSLESFKTSKNKKGSLSVDDDFLHSLNSWRTKLAHNIFSGNSQLDGFLLTNIVQKIIDRIIFLRIAEDRNIEPYGNLKEAVSPPNGYPGFLGLCEASNEKYNSGLFYLDSTLRNLRIDNEVFCEIIDELYFPNSPYEFSVLPVDILGKAYEQFLGKVIVINAKGKLSVVEKPEVKKAGGVHYTPKYIVESIVQDTLGRVLANKKPAEIANCRILDPACGSGTFLITAFEFLLKWYKDFFIQNPTAISKKEKREIVSLEGELTTKFKKKILLEHIYGVDVDRNAVEVTKLSLLLKCLEGENRASVDTQMSMFHERVLPTLDDNIKSGNTLVDFDIYRISPSLEEDRVIKRKINSFNWETSFRDVFKDKEGFDIIVGNPPYVRHELLVELKPYFANKYEVFNGKADLYVYFLEKCFSLLSLNGVISFVLANKWFRASYGWELREWLTTKVQLEFLKDFGDLAVFEKATTYPCIIRIKNGTRTETFDFVDLTRQGFKDPRDHKSGLPIPLEVSKLEHSGWILADEAVTSVLEKIADCSVELDSYISGCCYRGIVTGKNEAFIINSATKRQLLKEDESSKDIIKRFIKGRDVKAYKKIRSNYYVIFTRRGINIDRYPAVKKHLLQFKSCLRPKPKDWKPSKREKRWLGRKPGSYKWYEIQDSIDYYQEFEKKKIVYANICKQPEFTLDESGVYTNQKCFIIPKRDLFLLGLLNSSLAHFWFEFYLPKLRGGFYEPNYVIFRRFPVVKVDENNDYLLGLKNNIEEGVKNLLSLSQQDESDDIKKEIEFHKSEIDSKVFEIYGLNRDEVKHVLEIIDNVKG